MLERVDACSARLDRVPDLLKRFRQSVLAAATSGQLTEDWREENLGIESANSLLLRIQESRLTLAKTAKEKRLIEEQWDEYSLAVGEGAYGFDDIPGSWLTCSIGVVANVCNGSTPSRSRLEFWDGDIPWVSSGEVRNNVITTTRERITEEGYEGASVKLLPAGTVLMAMIGEGKTRGQSALLAIASTINQNIAAVILDHGLVRSEYVWRWFQLQYEATRMHGNGTGPQALNCQRVRELPFILPPLPEQQEIVRRVEALFSFADRIEARVTEARAQVDRLTPATLAKAFRGELVPQDPNDEPASALLERLRTEFAESGLPRNGRKVHARMPTEAPEAKPRRATVAPSASRSLEFQPAAVAVAARPKAASVAPAPASPTPVTDLDKDDWMSLLREVLTAHGPCDRETVIQQAAYALDYQRAGRVVAAEIDNAIRAAVRRRVVLHEGHELRVNRASIAVMEAEDRDFMKDQFLAAISQNGRIWIDREEAARRYALWFGFRRTGSQIQDRVKSLINGLLRDQRLESDGPRIRRAS